LGTVTVGGGRRIRDRQEGEVSLSLRGKRGRCELLLRKRGGARGKGKYEKNVVFLGEGVFVGRENFPVLQTTPW